MTTTELTKRTAKPGEKIFPGPTPLGDYLGDNTEWDFPPPYFVPVPPGEKIVRSNSAQNAAKANAEPLVLNENCGKWDAGDLYTWVLIAAMFLLGLTIAFAAYLLPHGVDSYVPPIKVY